MSRNPAPFGSRATPHWRKPTPITSAGIIIAGGLFALGFAALIALMMAAGSGSTAAGSGADAYLTRVTIFTFMQAFLSAFLALIIALPVARSCWRRTSEWNAHLLILFSFLPIVLPTTVAATGLIGVWGQSGLFSGFLGAMGLPKLPPIYGLGGVLLAHVFFNAPLMLRVLSGVMAGIPVSHWRLSAEWGLDGWQRFRLIEWPALRRVIPGLLALIFLLCFTSFSLIMILGGGPSVTTLEVNIYTALRFEFDLEKAGKLALLQLAICASVVVCLAKLGGPSWAAAPSTKRPHIRQKGEAERLTRFFDALILGLFIILVVLPVIAVVWRGINGEMAKMLSWPHFYRAAMNSLLIALASGTLATGLALVLAATRTARANAGLSVWGLDVAISLYLAVSAIVLGTGFFILLRGFADMFFLAPALVLLANMLVALPFAYRVIEGRMAALAATHDKLCAGLGVRGWRRFRWITLPALAPEIGYAAGLSAALSLGDMTVIALFGSQQFQTLPWLLYQTMSRYRSGEAASLALLLLCLTLLIFALHVGAARWLAHRPNHL